MNLNEFFKANTKVALGFSGGTDSAYLLYTAVKCGADIRPYFVKSIFQPAFELKDAMIMCNQLGVELTIIEAAVHENAEVMNNPPNRCYLCKKYIFGLISENAHKDGYPLIIDGNNASDSTDDRPGMKACLELGIRSPLRECDLTKSEVRGLSKEANLFTWKKPSYACLATRIPTGTQITTEQILAVEKSEDYLFSLGFNDFRVRVINKNTAKLELSENDLQRLIKNRINIIKNLVYFKEIMLDLKVRSCDG